jgi:hypothetical protein
MNQPATLGEIRKRVALRAEALTGVSSSELLRELGTAHVAVETETDGPNWSIDILSPSAEVRNALVQAIREMSVTMPIAIEP